MIEFLSSILDAIFVVVLVWTIFRTLRSFFRGARKTSGGTGQGSARAAAPLRGEMARDPVCGIFVSTELSHRMVRGGETLHFCSEECLKNYQKTAVKA